MLLLFILTWWWGASSAVCRNSLAYCLTCPSWLAWFFAGDSLFNGHERTTGSLSQLHLTASTRGGPRLSLQLWKVNAIILAQCIWDKHGAVCFFFPSLPLLLFPLLLLLAPSILNCWRGLEDFVAAKPPQSRSEPSRAATSPAAALIRAFTVGSDTKHDETFGRGVCVCFFFSPFFSLSFRFFFFLLHIRRCASEP